MNEMPGSDDVLVYVGLGSNLAQPISQVRSGMAALKQLAQTQVEACSSLYASAPVGVTAQPDFVNAVCRLRTALRPEVMLQCLLDIEQTHGRLRQGAKGEPRTLDLDLLLYGEQEICTPHLTVPHPRLHERAFVLYPLSEIDPTIVVPRRGRVADLLVQCTDQRVQLLENG